MTPPKLHFEKASKTVKNIRSVYVENMHANVEDDKIVSYGVNAKISFELDGENQK